jgi:hypothetical protein
MCVQWSIITVSGSMTTTSGWKGLENQNTPSTIRACSIPLSAESEDSDSELETSRPNVHWLSAHRGILNCHPLYGNSGGCPWTELDDNAYVEGKIQWQEFGAIWMWDDRACFSLGIWRFGWKDQRLQNSCTNRIHYSLTKQPALLPKEKEPFNPSGAPLRVGFILLGTSLVYCRSA